MVAESAPDPKPQRRRGLRLQILTRFLSLDDLGVKTPGLVLPKKEFFEQEFDRLISTWLTYPIDYVALFPDKFKGRRNCDLDLMKDLLHLDMSVVYCHLI